MHGVEVGMSSRTILLSCLLLITTTATTAYPLRLSGFLPHHMPRGSALFFFLFFFFSRSHGFTVADGGGGIRKQGENCRGAFSAWYFIHVVSWGWKRVSSAFFMSPERRVGDSVINWGREEKRE